MPLFFSRSLDVSLFSFLRRERVLNLRFPNLDLIGRDTNHFAIAPDGNRNSVAAMFGDSLSYSLPKSLLSPISQRRRRFPLFFIAPPCILIKYQRDLDQVFLSFPAPQTQSFWGHHPNYQRLSMSPPMVDRNGKNLVGFSQNDGGQ